MNSDFMFISFDGLDDQTSREIYDLINTSGHGRDIEFPWHKDENDCPPEQKMDEGATSKGSASSLNVYAPEFQSTGNNTQKNLTYHNRPKLPNPHFYRTTPPYFPNGVTPKAYNGDATPFVPSSSFKLNPTVSSFVPSNNFPDVQNSVIRTSRESFTNSFSEPALVEPRPVSNIHPVHSVSVTQNGPVTSDHVNHPVVTNVSLAKIRPELSKPVSEHRLVTELSQPVPVEHSRPVTGQLSKSGELSKTCTTGHGRPVQTSKPMSEEHIRPAPVEHRPALNVSAPGAQNKSIPISSVEYRPVTGQLSKSATGELSKTEHGRPVSVQTSKPVSEEHSKTAPASQNKSVPISPAEHRPVPGVQNVSALGVHNVSSPVEHRSVSNVSAPVEQRPVSNVSAPVEHRPVPNTSAPAAPNKSVPQVQKDSTAPDSAVSDAKTIPNGEVKISGPRSWAQIVSKGQKSPCDKSPVESQVSKETEEGGKETEESSIEDDKMALKLGEHLSVAKLNFDPVYFQPRGLINRRNWCYVNATLQALLACSPFYTLLRNLPLGPFVDRGKSATPVIDSMVKVTYKFPQLSEPQEEMAPGQPFQPDFIYDMLRDQKSDCLKGQQEDAEEFLSFILNRMHEEMVKIIKHYHRKNPQHTEEVDEEEEEIEGEDEWQVIGAKHKGMVTRKVTEHRSPISDLLGGQMKALVTVSGSKTSASIQPFFTLQMDIQSEGVNSVTDALKEMTVKELIQDYTCAKTKQKVDAFNHIALQKVPPILILHLKRFVYSKNGGGCKKVMKKTQYPLELEIGKEIFSPDVKKTHPQCKYKLFAVMYHDGEEAVKGHYISDVVCGGNWIRCDDRTIAPVTEEQVLSHAPPRVPYLLFYQSCF